MTLVSGECGTDAPCLEQAFGNLAFRNGPSRPWVVYEQKLVTDPAVEKDCHRIAHFIGSASLERFHGNVAKTFAQGSSLCVSGYYHGILERAFLGITNKAGLERKARGLCLADGIRRRGFLDYQCRHGLGHGLMIQSGYDLPLALDICARLGTGWDQKACASGAFMENINTAFGLQVVVARRQGPAVSLRPHEGVRPTVVLPARELADPRPLGRVVREDGEEVRSSSRPGRRPVSRDTGGTSQSTRGTWSRRSDRCAVSRVRVRVTACAARRARLRTRRERRASRRHGRSVPRLRFDTGRTASAASGSSSACSIPLASLERRRAGV